MFVSRGKFLFRWLFYGFFYLDNFCKTEMANSSRWIVFLIKFWLTRQTGRKCKREDIIISLTSYPKRFRFLRKTLKSIISQNTERLPILVNLYFPDFNKLTKDLLKLKKFGVTYYPIDENLRQYLKLIPTIQRFPVNSIITADDDIYYPLGWVSGLLNAHSNHPHSIMGYRGLKILRESNGSFSTYKTWPLASSNVLDSQEVLLTGVGGILYPRNCFTDSVFDMKEAFKLTPGNDDLWFYFKAREASSRIRLVPKTWTEPRFWFGSQKSALWHTNISKSKNDDYLRNFFGFTD